MTTYSMRDTRGWSEAGASLSRVREVIESETCRHDWSIIEIDTEEERQQLINRLAGGDWQSTDPEVIDLRITFGQQYPTIGIYSTRNGVERLALSWDDAVTIDCGDYNLVIEQD